VKKKIINTLIEEPKKKKSCQRVLVNLLTEIQMYATLYPKFEGSLAFSPLKAQNLNGPIPRDMS